MHLILIIGQSNMAGLASRTSTPDNAIRTGLESL